MLPGCQAYPHTTLDIRIICAHIKCVCVRARIHGGERTGSCQPTAWGTPNGTPAITHVRTLLIPLALRLPAAGCCCCCCCANGIKVLQASLSAPRNLCSSTYAPTRSHTCDTHSRCPFFVGVCVCVLNILRIEPRGERGMWDPREASVNVENA